MEEEERMYICGRECCMKWDVDRSAVYTRK
jgi:hypothetical protein